MLVEYWTSKKAFCNSQERPIPHCGPLVDAVLDEALLEVTTVQIGSKCRFIKLNPTPTQTIEIRQIGPKSAIHD